MILIKSSVLETNLQLMRAIKVGNQMPHKIGAFNDKISQSSRKLSVLYWFGH